MAVEKNMNTRAKEGAQAVISPAQPRRLEAAKAEEKVFTSTKRRGKYKDIKAREANGVSTGRDRERGGLNMKKRNKEGKSRG